MKKLLILLIVPFLSFGQIDQEIYNFMNKENIPSISASIVKNGEIIWMKSYGYANLSNQIEADNNTVYMLASCSKTITATALMQLYEQGLFQLDDPINNYLPFSVFNPNYETDITFRMLLTHTSSIRDNWNNMPYSIDDGFIGDYPITLEEYLSNYLTSSGNLYNSNQNFYNNEPGVTYKYSNIAVAVIGYLVEIISQNSFDEYCEESIFNPMCMNSCNWFFDQYPDPSIIAIPYEDNVSPSNHYGYADFPSGQLRSNIIDISNFLIMYLNQGTFNGNVILSNETINMMHSIQFGNDQGLIWYIENFDGDDVWAHNGGDLGVSTDIFFSPENNIGVAVLSNGESYLDDINDIIYNYAKSLDGSVENYPDCSEPLIQEEIVNNYQNKNLLNKIDILGRETNTNKGLQLEIYDDGSVEKKYLIK